MEIKSIAIFANKW